MKLPSVFRATKQPRADHGNALGETALVMPLIFMMVLGTLDMARLFYTATSLSNAAREAAKKASLVSATFQQAGNAQVVRTAYCELPAFSWNFTPPAVATPCDPSKWSNWAPDPYDYNYTPVPPTPAPSTAYLYIAEDVNFPQDVPGPAPSPNWDATAPKNAGLGNKRRGNHIPVLVQIDYYWQPITPFIGSLFSSGLIHIQVASQQAEQY